MLVVMIGRNKTQDGAERPMSIAEWHRFRRETVTALEASIGNVSVQSSGAYQGSADWSSEQTAVFVVGPRDPFCGSGEVQLAIADVLARHGQRAAGVIAGPLGIAEAPAPAPAPAVE